MWQGYSAAVTALAASLLLVVGLRTADKPPVPQPAPEARPVMVATLAPETGPASLTASYDPSTNSLVVAPAALSPVAGHDHELWIIPDDGKPRSLGLVAASEQRRMPLPAGLPPRLVETATIALSAEPAGGSPTGQPTGPVVASGKFSRV
jgi:anti-sigma-K factor RskA